MLGLQVVLVAPHRLDRDHASRQRPTAAPGRSVDLHLGIVRDALGPGELTRGLLVGSAEQAIDEFVAEPVEVLRGAHRPGHHLRGQICAPLDLRQVRLPDGAVGVQHPQQTQQAALAPHRHAPPSPHTRLRQCRGADRRGRSGEPVASDDGGGLRVDLPVEDRPGAGCVDGSAGAPPHRTLVPVLDEHRLLEVGGEAVDRGLHVGPVRHRTHLPKPLSPAILRTAAASSTTMTLWRHRGWFVAGWHGNMTPTPR